MLSALAAAGAIPPLRVVHDIAEMRRSVGADAARLCALNATEDELAAVVAAAEDYPEPGGGPDVFGADLAFWTAVIAGSGNVAYRLGLNTLVAAFADVGWQTVAELGLAGELADRDAHRDLARLIGARDAAGARRLAGDLLSRFVDDLTPADVPAPAAKG